MSTLQRVLLVVSLTFVAAGAGWGARALASDGCSACGLDCDCGSPCPCSAP